MKPFHHVLINTALANMTTSYLWFALTFWLYLETRNVAVSAVIGAGYMGLVALFSLLFGVIVDHNRKKKVMVFAAATTLLAYLLAGSIWLASDHQSLVSLTQPAFWLFAMIILGGSVVAQMRNIALSTTVTLLVPEGERDKANGLVGMVQGLAFFVTSVFSGLSIGFLGMGTTLWIAIALTVIAFLHLLPVRIPEGRVITAAETQNAVASRAGAGARGWVSEKKDPKVDLAGSLRTIRAVPGLIALILFACFNNFVFGTFQALQDPYGLELFSPQMWGIVLGVTSLGLVVGGGIVSKTGLGANPVRTLLLLNMGIALVGMAFTLREWWWLLAAGLFIVMMLMPAVEAAEQTILQRVVPFRRQGRVFGLAQSIETAASPISAFFVGILAQQTVIPWVDSPSGQEALGWMLGSGNARGMALMFVLSGLIMLVVVLLAFVSRQYRALSRYYQENRQDLAAAETNSALAPAVHESPAASVAEGELS